MADLSAKPRTGHGRHGFVRLHRRDLVWINVTTSPTAEWVARQITEAFPWDEAPRYMIRTAIGSTAPLLHADFAHGIRDKPIAPSSPWQNGFAERLIGSIRRECLDHVIVLGEAHLHRILKSYADYYNSVRNASVFAQGCADLPPDFIRPESFVHTRSSAGFTITTSGFKFSVHTTGCSGASSRPWRPGRRHSFAASSRQCHSSASASGNGGTRRSAKRSAKQSLAQSGSSVSRHERMPPPVDNNCAKKWLALKCRI